MLSRRFHLPGLFAVLLALMALLGAGASVSRNDPLAGVGILCHTDNGGAPSKAPHHPFDCPLCPLCVIMHAPPATLVSAVEAPAPSLAVVVLRTELPLSSAVPPTPHRPPSQPRAPPIFS